MITAQKILTGTMVLLVLWILTMTIIPFLINGWLYQIQQPAPVVRVTPTSVVLEVTRFARVPMAGRCTRELQCDELYDFPPFACPLEQGMKTILIRVPIPQGATGGCQVQGQVEYSPLGLFGPDLVYHWTSELFQISEDTP